MLIRRFTPQFSSNCSTTTRRLLRTMKLRRTRRLLNLNLITHLLSRSMIIISFRSTSIILTRRTLSTTTTHRLMRYSLLLRRFIKNMSRNLRRISLLFSLPRRLISPFQPNTSSSHRFVSTHRHQLKNHRTLSVSITTNRGHNSLIRRARLIFQGCNSSVFLFFRYSFKFCSDQVTTANTPTNAVKGALSSLSAHASDECTPQRTYVSTVTSTDSPHHSARQ